MKIAICSDLHLEFGPIELKNEQNADVLVLSGDICTAKVFTKGTQKERDKYRQFFAQVAKEFKHVVYVMGNHEHYDYDVAKSEGLLKLALITHDNIHLLEKQCVEIDGVTFVGGTLWTDMNKRDPITMYHVGHRMNDFQLIKNSNRMVNFSQNIYKKMSDGSDLFMKNPDGSLVLERVDHYQRAARFSPEDAIEEFDKTAEYIRIAVNAEPTDKFVVCTHHAPTPFSCNDKYKHDTLMNGAYYSDLTEFILDNPQIKLWTHGHMHDPSDYMIKGTRVVCNPRGYINYEVQADTFELKYVEI